MTVLAHAFVRPLVQAQCSAVRDAALRVAASAEAEGQLDADAIHDHRVAMRRLRTLLGAAAPLFKRKPLAQVLDGLRGFAQAAGAVRNEEVLVETLAKLELPGATRARIDAWLATRGRRERELRAAVVAQLARAPQAAPNETNARRDPARHAPALSEVLALAENLPLKHKAEGISARALALEAMAKAAAKALADAARPDAESPPARHELRIRMKRVRYTGELLSKAIAKDGPVAAALADRVKAATRMQKRLGDLHDQDEAIACITRARSVSLGDRMVVHHHLRSARTALEVRIAKELPAVLALLGGGDGARPLE